MNTTNKEIIPKVRVHALDYEGRGVARIDGKAVFIEGALPGEEVSCRITRSKKHFDEAETVAVLQASDQREAPRCPHFSVCGGCVLQHARHEAQVAYKQRVLEEQLQRIGKVMPEQILPPIYGQPWGYRQRARLAVAEDSTGHLYAGFKARKSNRVVKIETCTILPPHISEILPELQQLLQGWRKEVAIRSIEISDSDGISVLTIVAKSKLDKAQLTALQLFSDRHLNQNHNKWQIWLQIGKQAAQAFYPPDTEQPYYRLPEFNLSIPYRPGDFTQVNHRVNALMVQRAVRLLDPQPGERIADLFCGLGNFTLAIARSGAEVVGIEGSAAQTEMAAANARLNGLDDNISFHTADLFQVHSTTVASWGNLDKILLDPPRSGALEFINALHTPYLPKKIVYVSCNPATLARDAAEIVKKGYKFKYVGVMNLFPQTAHIESVGCFER